MAEDKFGGCQKSFSWLSQKVSKKIDAYGTMLTPRHGKTSRHGSEFEFEAIEYSYSIRYSIRIRNFEDIRFYIRFE